MHFDAREITAMLTMVFGSLLALFSIPEKEIVQRLLYYALKYLSTPVARFSSLLNTVICRLLCRSLLF